MARAGTNHKGGRPKGAKSQSTLEKEAVLAAFRERAMKHADILFNAQLTLARGQVFLYKIEKELQIGPKGGKKYVNSRPKVVTDQWEIEAWLAGQIPDGDMEDEKDPNGTYYYLTTKEPNNQAVDSLLDRAFGKSTQIVEADIKSDGEKLTVPDGQYQQLIRAAATRLPHKEGK